MGMAANNTGTPNWAVLMDRLDRELRSTKVYHTSIWEGKGRRGKELPDLRGFRVTSAKWMHDISKARYSLNLTFSHPVILIPKENLENGIYEIWSQINMVFAELNYDKTHLSKDEARLDFNIVGVHKKRERKKNHK